MGAFREGSAFSSEFGTARLSNLALWSSAGSGEKYTRWVRTPRTVVVLPSASGVERDLVRRRLHVLPYNDFQKLPIPSHKRIPFIRIVGVAIIDSRHTLLYLIQELTHYETRDPNRSHIACRRSP